MYRRSIVVEGDHLVRELDVLAGERVQRPAQGAQHEVRLLPERQLERGQLLLEGGSHPKRPVT
jgi:hypothetical protein